MTSEGVIKVRSFGRRNESERWNMDILERCVGTPWEPIPGSKGTELRISVRLQERKGGEKISLIRIEEPEARNLYMQKVDIEKYGYIVCCKGCIAASRGTKSMPHSNACGVHIEQLIQENEPSRHEKNL